MIGLNVTSRSVESLVSCVSRNGRKLAGEKGTIVSQGKKGLTKRSPNYPANFLLEKQIAEGTQGRTLRDKFRIGDR
jgi:hypothetical protein